MLFWIVSELLLSAGLFHISSVHVVVQPQQYVASFVPLQSPLYILSLSQQYGCPNYDHDLGLIELYGSPCLPASKVITSTERVRGLDVTYHSNSSEPPLTTAETFPALWSSLPWKDLSTTWAVVDGDKSSSRPECHKVLMFLPKD